MKTKSQILQRILQIETERKELLKDYAKSSDEHEKSIIAERNIAQQEIVQQLRWVLNG